MQRARLGFALAATGLGWPPVLAQYVCAVEPNHSGVIFSVPIAGGMTRVSGRFKEFTAEIVYDDKDVTRSAVTAKLKAATIDTGIEMRDNDLRGPQFFDTEKHPEIIFRSTRVEKKGERLLVSGELTLRGVTKPVELPAVLTGVERNEEGRPLLGVSMRFKLSRKDFGVGTGWQHTTIPNFIGDEVSAEIDLWTRRCRKPEAAPKPPVQKQE